MPWRSFGLSCSPRWSRGSLLSPVPWLVSRRCSVSNGSASMRLVGISSLEGFACAHLRPITAISSAQSRSTGRFISQSSTLLLVGKAGWLASGTRGRLICQLRQFGPPLCGPPYRRPPAESSHGSYGRRALFQELSIFFQILLGCFFYFFSPCVFGIAVFLASPFHFPKVPVAGIVLLYYRRCVCWCCLCWCRGECVVVVCIYTEFYLIVLLAKARVRGGLVRA